MQIDKFKDYSGLLLRWTLIVVSISFAWSNLDNRVSNLEADVIPISKKIDFLVEANQAMMLDIAVIKEKVMQLENKVDKP
jgi:regulator of replication initiation timing